MKIVICNFPANRIKRFVEGCILINRGKSSTKNTYTALKSVNKKHVPRSIIAYICPNRVAPESVVKFLIKLFICLVTKNLVEVHYVRALPILGVGWLWRPSIRLRCTQSKLCSWCLIYSLSPPPHFHQQLTLTILDDEVSPWLLCYSMVSDNLYSTWVSGRRRVGLGQKTEKQDKNMLTTRFLFWKRI